MCEKKEITLEDIEIYNPREECWVNLLEEFGKFEEYVNYLPEKLAKTPLGIVHAVAYHWKVNIEDIRTRYPFVMVRCEGNPHIELEGKEYRYTYYYKCDLCDAEFRTHGTLKSKFLKKCHKDHYYLKFCYNCGNSCIVKTQKHTKIFLDNDKLWVSGYSCCSDYDKNGPGSSSCQHSILNISQMYKGVNTIRNLQGEERIKHNKRNGLRNSGPGNCTRCGTYNEKRSTCGLGISHCDCDKEYHEDRLRNKNCVKCGKFNKRLTVAGFGIECGCAAKKCDEILQIKLGPGPCGRCGKFNSRRNSYAIGISDCNCLTFIKMKNVHEVIKLVKFENQNDIDHFISEHSVHFDDLTEDDFTPDGIVPYDLDFKVIKYLFQNYKITNSIVRAMKLTRNFNNDIHDFIVYCVSIYGGEYYPKKRKEYEQIERIDTEEEIQNEVITQAKIFDRILNNPNDIIKSKINVGNIKKKNKINLKAVLNYLNKQRKNIYNLLKDESMIDIVEINLNNLDDLAVIGVWCIIDENDNVLDVCKTKNIKDEILKTEKRINYIRNGGKLSRDYKTYKYQKISENNIKYCLVKITESEYEALIVEMKFASASRAKYWNPEPGQIKLIEYENEIKEK